MVISELTPSEVELHLWPLPTKEVLSNQANNLEGKLTIKHGPFLI